MFGEYSTTVCLVDDKSMTMKQKDILLAYQFQEYSKRGHV